MILLCEFSSTFTVVDSTEMKGMDDEQLDNILDSLLVKIVETLVEVSASECNIQDELTAPDKSGFTLLHYVRKSTVSTNIIF